MKHTWIRALFGVAGVYDGVLGLAFVCCPYALFSALEVTPPNHGAYARFPAALLVLFAVMFFRIAYRPLQGRELMLYGAGLKLAYISTVFAYALTTGIPSVWQYFAAADVVFLLLFLLAWLKTRERADSATA